MPLTVTLDRLVELGRRLRSAGLVLTPDIQADIARSLTLVGYTHPSRVYWAIRAVVITDRSQVTTFDKVFREFFGLVPDDARPDVGVRRSDQVSRLAGLGDSGEETAEASVEAEVGGSAVERLARRDFADLDPAEAEAVKTLIARMAWSPPDLRTRRRTPHRKGSRIDLRRSLRAATGPKGDLLPLAWTTERTRQRPLILIADVSGSMEAYADMFLTFAHAIRARFGPVESFVFSTRLTRISRALERRDLTRALRQVGEEVEDWSGGTRIGDALTTFNREWSRRVCRGRPYVLILSDGWDCGDRDVLKREIARLSRTVDRVLWMNPLAARDRFTPESQGMRTVLPYIDDLLPAASVQDLRDLVALLESLPSSTQPRSALRSLAV